MLTFGDKPLCLVWGAILSLNPSSCCSDLPHRGAIQGLILDSDIVLLPCLVMRVFGTPFAIKSGTAAQHSTP